MSNLRSAPRVKSFLRGEIIFANGASRTECTVRDISDVGARVQIPESITVPECFDLVIPQKGLTERSKTVWRHGSEIGVTFESLRRANTPGEFRGDIEQRLIELEGETNKLRQQLATMRAMVEQVYRERA